MTAIGFLLLAICLPLFGYSTMVDNERLGFPAFFGSLVGAFLLVLGIGTWLWRVMP